MPTQCEYFIMKLEQTFASNNRCQCTYNGRPRGCLPNCCLLCLQRLSISTWFYLNYLRLSLENRLPKLVMLWNVKDWKWIRREQFQALNWSRISVRLMLRGNSEGPSLWSVVQADLQNIKFLFLRCKCAN